MPETEYRVSWEMPSAIFCAELESRKGKQVWATLPELSWDHLPWTKTQRVTKDPDVLDQAEQLLNWAASHEQPIRNVVIESRVIPDGSDWEVIRSEGVTDAEAPSPFPEPMRLQDTPMAKQIRDMHKATGHFIAIDADCPGCGHPERRFNGDQFSCRKCDFVSEERDS